jgi:hypothetical protein
LIEFPKSTFYGKKLAKQKFYDNMGISNAVKDQFVNEIESIYWKNILNSFTLNVNKGSKVTEIEILEIYLKNKNISKNIIEFIDSAHPNFVVFVIKFENLAQIWISYKEKNKSCEGKFKIGSFYKTEWQNEEDLSLKIEGLDLDKIYENFILQVAGGRIELIVNSERVTVKEAVERNKNIEKLEASIKSLEAKIRSEKQYNRQVKLMADLRRIKSELENYTK